ncbi:MAG: hypothetical protein O9249_00350 [Burkholderiaceae bacterium]|nr:hypothetical protein [Burkholderiaceae bacterium]
MFNEYSASPLKGTLFPAISNFKDAGAQHLVVLAALGLAYCYIASAPMLTLHALRGELTTNAKSSLSLFTPVFLAYFLVLFAIAYAVVSFGVLSWKSFAIASGCSVIAMQLALFSIATWNRFERISDYYLKLSAARSSETRQVQEYVESYRHMREHGNAFAIVLLELGLAMTAISVPNLSLLSALLTAWVLPASAVWLVGTVLESRLSKVPTK